MTDIRLSYQKINLGKATWPNTQDDTTEVIATTTTSTTIPENPEKTAPPFSGSTSTAENISSSMNISYLPTFDKCGVSSVQKPDSRIVNGINSTLHAWPWIATLGYKVNALQVELFFELENMLRLIIFRNF